MRSVGRDRFHALVEVAGARSGDRRLPRRPSGRVDRLRHAAQPLPRGSAGKPIRASSRATDLTRDKTKAVWIAAVSVLTARPSVEPGIEKEIRAMSVLALLRGIIARCGHVLACLAVAACSASGSTQSPTSIPSSTVAPVEYQNHTPLHLGLFVNGSSVRSIDPSSAGSVEATQLPSQPWTIEVRTTSGRVVASLSVKPGDVKQDVQGSQGDGVRVGLSCGSLDLWSGPPLAGPAAGTGQPGDCNP